VQGFGIPLFPQLAASRPDFFGCEHGERW
jgi:hypothetical protein